MDGATFDRIVKQMSRRRTRRQALAVGVTGMAAGVTLTGPSARDAVAQLEAFADTNRLEFPNGCEHFAISGSRRRPKANFNYDDDMTITLIRGNGERRTLLKDHDGEIGVGGEDVPAIKFEANDGDELKIVARDRQPCCYSLEPMYIHCCTNKRCKNSREAIRLTKGVKRTEPNNWKKRVFFRETYDIRIG
jgi:hypothetical protein